MALNLPHLGYVVRETVDKIIVFGEKNNRYDIPKSEIQMTGRNVLIGHKVEEIAKKYKIRHEAPLPTTTPLEHWSQGGNIDLAAYEREYPKSLFNKGVRTYNEDDVGHVMKETNDIIVVFGHRNYRFDIPKSRMIAIGRNVILDMDFPEVFKYQIHRDTPFPSDELKEKLAH